MREIKFRAWDKNEKRMLSDEWIQTLDLKTDGSWAAYIGGGMKRYLRSSIGAGARDIFYNDIELMQYTGLKDCKGKEIYEGDILRQHKTSGQMFKVIWDADGKWMVRDIECNMQDFLWRWASVTEVIGNIYENKELI